MVSPQSGPHNQGYTLTNPAKVICFILMGIMILMMMQALGEMAVLYPVNGAFFTYMVRFLDPSW